MATPSVTPRFVVRRAALAAALTALAACGGESPTPLTPTGPRDLRQEVAESPRTIVIAWDDVALQAIRIDKPAPTVVARALAVMHTAMYDAWAAYDAKAVGTRLGGSLRRPAAERTEANKRKAVSFAAYRSLVDLFPAQEALFAAKMRELRYDPADLSTDRTTAVGIANVATGAVLAMRHADGANQKGALGPTGRPYSDYTGYAPVNPPDRIVDPLRWQPLRIGGTVQSFATPHFGRVTPFALSSGSQLRPPVLLNQRTTQGMKREIDRLLEIGRTLGDREKVIAEYWADGPSSELPPGHWCVFAAWVSLRDQHTLDQDVKLLFVLSNAGLDAGIAAWDAKRHYDSARPVSAIRHYMKGKTIRAWGGPGEGTIDLPGERWQPYQELSIVTPPFAEFTSGHSTFSAASAEVLRRFTGSDHFGASVIVPRGSGRAEPGLVPATDVTLSWRTFSEAADEAGMSRRYGGIHFEEGDVWGRRMGRQIGNLAWHKAQKYFDGTAR